MLDKPLTPGLLFNAAAFDAAGRWESVPSSVDVVRSKTGLSQVLVLNGIPPVSWHGEVIDKPDHPPAYIAAATIQGLKTIKGPEAGTLTESASRLAYLLLLDEDFGQWVKAQADAGASEGKTFLVASDGRPLLV